MTAILSKKSKAKPRKTAMKGSGEAFPKPYTTTPMNQRPSARKSGRLSIY